MKSTKQKQDNEKDKHAHWTKIYLAPAGGGSAYIRVREKGVEKQEHWRCIDKDQSQWVVLALNQILAIAGNPHHSKNSAEDRMKRCIRKAFRRKLRMPAGVKLIGHEENTKQHNDNEEDNNEDIN